MLLTWRPHVENHSSLQVLRDAQCKPLTDRLSDHSSFCKNDILEITLTVEL